MEKDGEHSGTYNVMPQHDQHFLLPVECHMYAKPTLGVKAPPEHDETCTHCHKARNLSLGDYHSLKSWGTTLTLTHSHCCARLAMSPSNEGPGPGGSQCCPPRSSSDEAALRHIR